MKMKLLKIFIVISVFWIVSLVSTKGVYAAARYSVATGNWNSTGTWSATSGGSSGASVPVAGDTVTVERNYTVTIIANAAADSIVVGTVNGAGTLRFSTTASRVLTVSGDVTVASNGSLTVVNATNVNAHTFNIGGNLTVDGTFDMGSAVDDYATVVFNGSSQQTISGSGATCRFFSLTASNTSSAGLVLGRNITITPTSVTTTTVTVTANYVFDLAGYTANRSAAGAGSFIVNAGATLKIGGTGTWPANYTTNTINATSIVVYNGTNQTVRAATYGNLTISGSGTKTLGASTTVSANLTISAGTLADGGYQLVGNASGTFSMASGSILLLGSGTTATSFPTNFTTGNCSLDAASTVTYQANATTTVSATPAYGNLSFLPTLATSGKTYTFAGAATINGDFTVNPTASSSLTLTVNLGGTTTVAATKTTTLTGTTSGLSNLDTVSGSSHAFSTGLLNIGAAGTLTARNSTLTLTGTSGTFTRTGTFDVSGGTSTVIFSQTSGDTTLTSGTVTFDNLTVNMAGYTGTLGQNITVNDTLTVTAGTLDTSSNNRQVDVKDVSIGASGTFYGRASTINVSGNWANSGVYTYGTSTTNLNGSGAQQVSGSTTFYVLAVTTSTARAITFVADSVTSIAENGTLTLTGASGNLLTLQSSTTTGWYLRVNPLATVNTISYVSVSKSNALQGKQINASNGTNTDGGLNLNWLFTSSSTTPAVSFSGVSLSGVEVKPLCSVLWYCGCPLTVAHAAAGGVAPVDKTVTYGTVLSSIAGTGSKCWITQNLGATDQASSATDSDEDSAGWYWQFNRKQGYRYTTTRTPDTEWITSINESLNWEDANDPCKLELGTDWRLPTSTEWSTADSTGGWDDYNETYASDLKLHVAGYLGDATGVLGSRGSYGYYWSSTQASATAGYNLSFSSFFSLLTSNYKATGFSVRCLRTP